MYKYGRTDGKSEGYILTKKLATHIKCYLNKKSNYFQNVNKHSGIVCQKKTSKKYE